MRTIPGGFLPHTVTVEPYEGQGAHGRVYGTPRPVRCAVEDQVRLVRGADGAESTSSTTVRCKPHHTIPPESRVTVWPDTPHERVAEVITTARRIYPGTPSHLEISLT